MHPGLNCFAIENCPSISFLFLTIVFVRLSKNILQEPSDEYILILFCDKILLNYFSVLCKFHFVDSKCAISPGNRTLFKHPTAVILVLNCTFYGRSVDTVIWTRNNRPIEDNDTLVDLGKHKDWSAVAIYTNSTSIQDAGEFTCTAKRGQHVSSCSVHPGKTLSFGFWSQMVEYSGSITLFQGCLFFFPPYWRGPQANMTQNLFSKLEFCSITCIKWRIQEI